MRVNLAYVCRIFVSFWLLAPLALGQDATTAATTDSTPFQTDATTLDKSPFLVPSSGGLGGAALTTSSYMESAYINPAGIGGSLMEKNSRGWVRELSFPYVAISMNQNSYNLRKEFIDQGAESDSTIGRAIVDAHADERQFARFSIAPSLTFGRLMATYIVDQQIAAIALGDGSDQVDLAYRSTTGLGIGGSYRDVKDRFQIGFFAASIGRTESAGRLGYDDIASNLKSRQDAVKDLTSSYQGVPVNIGASFNLSKKGSIALAVVLRDAGDTLYVANDSTKEDVTVKQRLSLGASINPSLGKWGDVTIEGDIDEWSIDDISVASKLKLGAEMNIYMGKTAHSVLRTAYSHAGLSFGGGIYLGLITLNLALHKEEVGSGDTRVVETRNEFSLAIDVVEH